MGPATERLHEFVEQHRAGGTGLKQKPKKRKTSAKPAKWHPEVARIFATDFKKLQAHLVTPKLG